MQLPILKLENIPFWYKAVAPKFFSDLRAAEIFVSRQKKPFRSGFSKTEGPERRFLPRKCRAKKILFLREK
jgi:hypothetical protein